MCICFSANRKVSENRFNKDLYKIFRTKITRTQTQLQVHSTMKKLNNKEITSFNNEDENVEKPVEGKKQKKCKVTIFDNPTNDWTHHSAFIDPRSLLSINPAHAACFV